MVTFLSRRSFAAGGAAILAGSAFAASGRRVANTPLGPVDVPAEPRRVVAIDSRKSERLQWLAIGGVAAAARVVSVAGGLLL